MQFKFSTEALEKIEADVVAVLCQQKTKDKDDKGIAVLQSSDGGTGLDKLFGGLISKIIGDEAFRGETGATKLIHTCGKIPAKAILLVGIGKSSELTLDCFRKVGAKIAAAVNEMKAVSVAGIVQPEAIKSLASHDRLEALVEGFILGSYKFETYKNKKDVEPNTLKEIIFIANGGHTKLNEAVERGKLIADGVNLVRDLVNLPAKDLTPDDLAKKAAEVAKDCRLACKILGPAEIKHEKMELFLAVNRGSHNEPRFIHLGYKPSGKPKAKVALIGKGITFDSGGYDLKPGRHMLDMKTDMAGAATCIAVMKIISALKPNVSVDAYIPATDNMIGAKAEVPGNIIRGRGGKTVEIVSTDAEGRLILADAISYATDNKPDYLIDIATLTGGVLYALGEIYTAVLGNDQKLIDKYLAASKIEAEPTWQLPLAKEYKKGLTEGPADLKNVAKTRADTIAGALFLEEFVGETKWAHLDIAESARAEEDRDYTPRGGTGATVRTLVRLLTSL